MIEGVSLHPLKQISVPNGDLWHAFKATDEGFVGFGEAYFTQVKPHAVKGWKRHNRYVLNLVVVSVPGGASHTKWQLPASYCSTWTVDGICRSRFRADIYADGFDT